MDRIHFGRTDDSRFRREFGREFLKVFEERIGMKFNRARYLLLTKEEQDRIVTEASKRVQEKRKRRLAK